MQCSSPLKGFRRTGGGWTADPRQSVSGQSLDIPCGQCMACRVNKCQEYTIRFQNEVSLHEANCFWTVTYRDEDLPPNKSLVMDHISAFVKRLRSRVSPVRFRFVCNSEYGPSTRRPHYHGLFFGLDFEDRVPLRKTDAGAMSFYSPTLTEVWGLGDCECAPVTEANCRYVAGHTIDKLNGKLADEAYSIVDPHSGEVVELERPSLRMSNRPGIGAGWIDAYECDAFPSGFLIIDGVKRPVPRYYKKRLKDRYSLPGSCNDPGKLIHVDDFEVMSRIQRKRGLAMAAENTPERLAVKDELLRIKISRRKRNAL